MTPIDEREETLNKPPGQRPEDIRSRPETIKERDAHFGAAEQAAGGLEPSQTGGSLGTGPDPDMRTGVERRHAEGGIPARSADGKHPYGYDDDPDSHGTKGGNTVLP
jgi:hypothetical protein